jgi:hypothetical protein
VVVAFEDETTITQKPHIRKSMGFEGEQQKIAPYMNPNERRGNQQIKLDVCANTFYQNIEELKDKVSEYLDKQFGTWC